MLVERLGAGLIVAAVAALLIGCGPSPAQRVVRYGGHALRALDEQVAPRYTEAHEKALVDAATLDAYQREMEPWNALQQTMQTTYDAFVAADLALEAGGEDADALRRAACLLAALDTVAVRLVALDVPVPAALSEALRFGESFTGTCEREGAP
jgi:uncharacterized MAPEG superfamily protein